MGQRPESGSVAGGGDHAPIGADGTKPFSNEPSVSDNPAQDSERRELSAGRTEKSPDPPEEQSAHTGADSEGNAVNSDEGTHADYSDTGGVPPISREKFDEILATEKGQRPPPDTYLPAEYIAEHLQNFEDGASRILIRSSYEEYGIGKPDPGRSEFVLTNADAKAMLDESGGDPIKLAQKLGIPEDQLANDSLVIVHFHPTSSYASHMPSGNEWGGANDQWLPGGRLPKGDLEAIVHTEDMANGRDYTVIDIATGDVL